MHIKQEDHVITKLVNLGAKYEQIRAMVLTSSLCNPNAPVDILSDYDVEIFAEDPTPFVESDEWFESFGPIMAVWRDEWGENEDHRWMRMVMYQDGTKMDIQVGYMDSLRKISKADSLPDGYDIGYKVILDKDGITASMKSPTYKAFVLSPPTQAHYIARLEAFWMNSTYVAKYLWRDDIIAAKWRLHELFDEGVREMLEWSIAMEHDWNWKPGALGRGLGKALDPDTYQQLLESYAGGDINDLWESLFRTTALFRQTAIKVADGLGFDYLHDLDRRVSTYHNVIRNLNPQMASRDDLACALREKYERD